MSRIEIHPIKSLDPVLRTEAEVTAGGILEHDRAWAIFDLEGKFVNGKRTAQVHKLRSQFDPTISEVELRPEGESAPARFALDDVAPLERWLGGFFGFPVVLKHEPNKGFPDDPEAFGPTIVSEASLRFVQDRYAELPLENVRRRFRTNVEIVGGPPFCEDALFGAPGERKPFRIGDVDFLGHNPCQRCVVPTRDPVTGEVQRGFQKSFSEMRKEHLPAWSDARRFNHFYRFAVNTSIPPSERGKRLRVGDTLSV